LNNKAVSVVHQAAFRLVSRVYLKMGAGSAQGHEPFTIYDPCGRTVLRGEIRQGETEIDLSALSNGMYSLVIGRSVLRVIVMRS
jgi:hypothetical protein